MDLLKGKLSKIYFIFLMSAIGSTIVSTIYVTVDMICVGHYEGPQGIAAISCVNPLWPIMIGPGILFGVGGAVMMGNRRGAGNNRDADEFFTLGFIFSLICAVAVSFAYLNFSEPLLRFFGAEGEILQLAKDYMKSVAIIAPTFTVCSCLASFLRGDGEAVIPTVATIIGGVINIFLDIFLVFDFGAGMGIAGAGLATSIGQAVAFLIIASYFLTKKCRLRLRLPKKIFSKIYHIISIGMAAFVVEMSFGITVTVYNKTITSHLSDAHLAVFGTIATLMSMFYCIFNGIGTALQPIAAANHGAGKHERVEKALHLSFYCALLIGFLFFLLTELFPKQLLKVYMEMTDEVSAIGADIVRIYTCALPIVGISVVCTYYFQSVLKRGMSICLSLMRGLVGPIFFAITVPLVFGYEKIWWSIPLAEIVTVIMAFVFMAVTSAERKKHLAEKRV